ncbi:class I SAM-dependent methyltransferase [Halomarina oriensis]|uniref:Methyltransferase domain-containing protein n=1 Tax=Halomarina oriensis TaxID=671145 RepID=A0A6B0GE35_9EURY|nr:class I SAM-dependent methyltransferase [Halomarina oriensis]MWG33072.1 methyltransferase domain-containing protein [Halomarina oriensis]
MDDASGADEGMALNRAHWEDLAALHPTTEFYDLDGFLGGESSLQWVEREELGDVDGRSLLHLQCHFGMDTLSWAREGAEVVGVDFSETAIETARNLASDADLSDHAQFVEANVYDAPTALADAEAMPAGGFDVVFTSYGVLTWLPDVEAWARVVADCLAPGGTFYVAEIHPFSHVLMDVGVRDGRLHSDWPYFGEGPQTYDVDGSYADEEADVASTETREWPHPLGDVVTALLDAGLDLEFLHEHEFACFEQVAGMEERDDGFWELPGASLPFLFSLKARAPE